MRYEREFTLLLLSILLASPVLSFIPQTTISPETTSREVEEARIERSLVGPEMRSVVAGTPHAPINITGNSQFEALAESESWDGDGSEEAPFIIEGFDIDLGGTNGNCIDISDTTVHFIIRNCTATGATGFEGAGIFLSNVTNCEVSDNTLYNNYNGLVIYGNNATILDNFINAGASLGDGISAYDMENSRISGSTVYGGGVGVHLTNLRQCEVSSNSIVSPIEVCMYLEGGESVTISGNTMTNGSLYGLYLEFTDNCTVIGNGCSLCSVGIELFYSDQNHIKQCILDRNMNGISFDVSGGNSVELCRVIGTSPPGNGISIDQDSYANRVKWNVFFGNWVYDAYCDALLNMFDYNYYGSYAGPDVDHDGIGDYPMLIGGSAENVDYHPLLMEPTYPSWSPAPPNQYLEFGDEFSYALQVSSPIPIDEWHVSDTVNFVIDNTGIIRDTDTLDVGTYPIEVVVTNVYGLSVNGSFTVTVEDSTSPIWISLIQDRTFSIGEDIEFQLMAWDLAGLAGWETSDSENFSIARTSFAETCILTIIDSGGLAAGQYPLTITVYDPTGNSISATFTVTVAADTEGTEGISFEFIASVAGLGLAIVALLIAVASFLTARRGS